MSRCCVVMNEYLLAAGHLQAEAAKKCPAGRERGKGGGKGEGKGGEKERAGIWLESIALHENSMPLCI